MNSAMKLRINGEPRTFDTGLSLNALLAQLQDLPDNFAIAVNQIFVPRSAYGETLLGEGDQIELLVPMQGG